jgi:hypothetical protein
LPDRRPLYPRANGIFLVFFKLRRPGKTKKPPLPAASRYFASVDRAYFSWVEMLVKFVFSFEPIVLTTAMMATEMPAAMRPYSMAVAPDSFFKNATILDIRDAPGDSLQDGSVRKLPTAGKEFLHSTP